LSNEVCVREQLEATCKASLIEKDETYNLKIKELEKEIALLD